MTTPEPAPNSSTTPGSLESVDRFLGAVYGDLDYLGRLDAMVAGKTHLSDADLGTVIEPAVDEVVRQLRLGVQPDDPLGLLWWLAGKRAGKLSAKRGAELSL